MEKQDLTRYNDGELGLWVQNDEGLYHAWNRAVDRGTYLGRDAAFEEFMEDNIRPFFIFTYDQEQDLRNDFDDYVNEQIKEESEQEDEG